MTASHTTITHPWQTAFMIWGSSALLNGLFYTVVAVVALAEENGGIIGLFIGLVSAIISLPAILILRSALPGLLNIKYRIQRIFGVSCFLIILFLMLAILFGMVCLSIKEAGISVQFGLSNVWNFLLLASPCLMGSMIATGYICRALLFRPSSLSN